MIESHEIEATAEKRIWHRGYAELKQIVRQYDRRGHLFMHRGSVSFFYWEKSVHLARGVEHILRTINMIAMGDR